MDLRDLGAVNARFNEDLRRLTPENADKIILWLGNPSDVLLSAGLADKELKLYGNKLLKKANKHDFFPADLKNLPCAVNDPIAIFDDKQYGGHTILTELKIKGNNVFVALDTGKGNDMGFNTVKSIFGKSSKGIIWRILCGCLLYVNKEKTLDYLRSDPALIAGAADSQELPAVQDKIRDFQNPPANEQTK